MRSQVNFAASYSTNPYDNTVILRSEHRAIWSMVPMMLIFLVAVALPYLVYQSFTNLLVNLAILITLATMWNLLAGYAGLVSVGQQAYIGIGAYTVLVSAQHGLEPFLAIPIAIVVCALFALPASLLVFRLRGGYFAIGTWVLAIVAEIVFSGIPSLGGGSGAALPGLSSMSPVLRGAYTYWAALGVSAAGLVAVYLLLRSRLGLVLRAMKDDELAARSSGSRVYGAKQAAYLLAAAGCGAAGALLIISQLNVEPSNVFSVNFSAEMIFAVLIGGVGTMEGPVIGAVAFILLQHLLASYGALYFIVLGAIAIVIALWMRKGLWGTFVERIPIRLFPVGYILRSNYGKDSFRKHLQTRL